MSLIKRITIVFKTQFFPGYGHRDNHDLSIRFGLNQGMLPEFILFKRKKLSNKNYDYDFTRYGSEVSIDHIKRFLKSKYSCVSNKCTGPYKHTGYKI